MEAVERVKEFGNGDRSGAHADSGFKNPAGVYKDSENQNEEQIKPAPESNKDGQSNGKDGQSNVAAKVDDAGKKKVNETQKAGNDTAKLVLKGVEQKVMAIGETMKNKTLEKLADLCVIHKKEYEKMIYERTKLSLNLSIEDIGNIMKDTEFFQKKQNLTEMEYQPLFNPKSNASKPMNISAMHGLGYCDCKDLSCLCCVRVFDKRMKLNSTACATITFSSKSQVSYYKYI